MKKVVLVVAASMGGTVMSGCTPEQMAQSEAALSAAFFEGLGLGNIHDIWFTPFPF